MSFLRRNANIDLFFHFFRKYRGRTSHVYVTFVINIRLQFHGLFSCNLWICDFFLELCRAWQESFQLFSLTLASLFNLKTAFQKLLKIILIHTNKTDLFCVLCQMKISINFKQNKCAYWKYRKRKPWNNANKTTVYGMNRRKSCENT